MFHKEYIRDRMLKEVSRIWNVEGHVSEDNYDPLVNMLITALSSESELIYKEISHSQNRVADSLMSKLIPYVNKGVQPGHSMVLLNPGEVNVMLPAHSELISQVRTVSNELKEIYFITSTDVNLFQGGVIKMSSSMKSYEIVDYRFKVESEKGDESLDDNQLSMVVEFYGDTLNLNSIPVFFDLRLASYKRQLFYDKLSTATFYINDIPVDKITKKPSDSFANNSNKPLVELESSALDFYKHQYFNLELPTCLRAKDGHKKNVAEGKNIFTITVDFGGFIHPEIFQDLFCYVNTVPVINIRKHQKIFKSRNDFSVFHLSQEDSFFCIGSIYTDDDKVYQKYEGGTADVNQQGTYLIRKSEVEGLTGKGAKELIDYLVGIMRNENAVLSNMSNGNFANDLKILKQITTKLEYSLANKKTENDSTYIFLKEEHPSEFVFVDYYTTKGDDTKGFKVNSPLFAYKGVALSQNGNFTLTPMIGGRKALKENEFMYEVRHAMLSGGRIVTHRDITSLLYKYYGDHVIDVKVQKGMMESSDLKRGYVRTVDVLVKTNGLLPEVDCISIGKIVLCELEEKGSDLYPYRLIVDEKEIVK